MELESHPDKARLMKLAFTIQNGRNEGEFLREMNPEYHAKVKQMQEELERVKPQ